MNTLTLSAKPAELALPLLRRLWRANPPLVVLGFLAAALMAFTAAMAVIDPRLIIGAPAWVKPLKFAISTVFYTLTLVGMLSYVEGHRRLVALVGWATTIALVVELALIVTQVLRGVRSHFNLATPLDGAIFSVMGVLIVVVWLMNLVAAALLLRQKLANPAFAWSLRLGLLVTLYGAGVAFTMTGPTPNQMAAMQAGAAPQYIGAHSVGVEDGGAGLPFVGWSTTGGDLRIPHFVGLHALQVIPLAGWLVNRRFGKLSARRRAALVWTAALGYLGLAVALTWQALRGQSIVAPDALTLAALGGLAAAVVAAATLIAWGERK